MSSPERDRVDRRLFTNPWPALIAGLIATAAASFWLQVFHHAAWPLLLGGLLATGAAVAIRPQSPAVLGLACLCGLFAGGAPHVPLMLFELSAVPNDWDSAQLLLRVLTALAGFAALVMLLPRVYRRVIVSLMVVLHFGGILTAVANVPPGPWVAGLAWAHFYRPYLEFMYLSNAYHFYSPEPGPGALIWFYVKFEDGTVQDYKIPNPNENPLALEYQRRLSFAESVNQVAPPGRVPEAVSYLRNLAGEANGIFLHPDYPVEAQYRPPGKYSLHMLETYARYAVRHVKNPDNPDSKAVSVKIYRVVHNIVSPKQILEGVPPDAEWLYYPFYQGEYSVKGKLLNPQDPYLYWMIPILKDPIPIAKRDGAFIRKGGNRETDEFVSNFFERHLHLPTTSMVGPEQEK